MKTPYRKLTKEEKRVISLLKKIDRLYDGGNVNIEIFGSAGGRLYALATGGNDFEEIREFEFRVGDLCANRIVFESDGFFANGGDPNFYEYDKI